MRIPGAGVLNRFQKNLRPVGGASTLVERPDGKGRW
jgi:hypothetical protein